MKNYHKIAAIINKEKIEWFAKYGYHKDPKCKACQSGLCMVEGRDIPRIIELVKQKELGE